MKVFKKVKASEELPKNSMDVFAFIGDIKISACYKGSGWYSIEFGPRTNIEYWLKEIDISESYIESIINNGIALNALTSKLPESTKSGLREVLKEAMEGGIKFIIDLLK